MRINVYREELTRRVEKVCKIVDGVTYWGLRVYLYLPVTTDEYGNVRGRFEHRDGDDSSAITFWGDSADLCNLVNDFCKAFMS